MISLIPSKYTSTGDLNLKPVVHKTLPLAPYNLALRIIQSFGSLSPSIYTRQNTKKFSFLLIAIPLALAIFPLAVIGHLLLTEPKKINI